MAEENRFAVATGNFSATSTWSLTSGGAAGASVPDTDQHAIIESGNNVTIDANDEIASLTVNSGGTLTGNASYSLTINSEGDATPYGTDGYSVRIQGALGANVNLIVTTDSNSFLDLVATSGNVEDLTINSASVKHRWVSSTVITGDLIISAGQFSCDDLTFTLEVQGDVSIASGGTLSMASIIFPAADSVGTQAATFGSLTIASGGTYIATGGTTTITSETSDHAWKNEGGTFTHNKGLVKFDTPANTIIQENTWYDFELYADGSSRQYEIRDVSGNEITFLGNLILTAGRLKTTTSSDTITVHGNTYITSSAKCWHTAHQDTNKITHHGLVTNRGEYKINDTTTVKMNGGIRQLGTLTIT